MMLLAIIFPWLSFFLRGSIIKGIFCLILQITLIGWIPAAFWAALDLQNDRANTRTERIVDAIKNK